MLELRTERDPQAGSIDGLCILIADDDIEMRRWLRALLERRGARIEEAASGWEVLYQLADHAFDLVITDVRMPMPNGVGVLSMARAAGIATPFLVITAFADPGLGAVIARSVDAALLDKPFDEDALLGHARELVNGV